MLRLLFYFIFLFYQFVESIISLFDPLSLLLFSLLIVESLHFWFSMFARLD